MTLEFRKIRFGSGQSAIEFALFLPLIFTILFWATDQFIKIYKTKQNYLSYYNETLKNTNNMRKDWKFEGESVSVDIRKFEIPKVGWGPGDLIDGIGDILKDKLTDGLMEKIGIGQDNWLESGIYNGVNAYVNSGFDINEFPRGFAYGVVASKDAGNFFEDKFGAVGGTGLQGAVSGAVISKGDWGYALNSGLSNVMATDAVQAEVSKVFGKNDILTSSALGAAAGYFSGGKSGLLSGAAEGALGSKTIQNPLGKALGGKDYLINATNVGLNAAITGNTDVILTRATQAAFMSNSVQKAVFGENPKSFIKNTVSSSFMGGVRAIETKDINQLYLAAAGSVVGEVVSATVKTMYPAPDDVSKMQSYMKKTEFVSGLATQGALLLSSKNFIENYSSMLANQMVIKGVQDKIDKVLPDSEQTPADDTELIDDSPENTDPAKKPAVEPLSVSYKIDKRIDEGLNVEPASEAPTDESAVRVKTVMLASAGDNDTVKVRPHNQTPLNEILLLAKAESVSRLPVKPDNSRQGKPSASGNTRQRDREQPMGSILSFIETITPEDILHGELYAKIEKSKPLAKEILKRELGRNLVAINSAILSKFGYVEEEADRILSGSEFQGALEKSLGDPVVNKIINKIIDTALSRENIRKTVVEIQTRIVSERAYVAELELRKFMWTSQIKGSIHSRSKRQNIVLEIYTNLKNKI